MADDVRALSATLAKDPASLVYVELAEVLRRRGKLAEAEQVARHGLGRHPEHADGWDTLARIQTDRGQLGEARGAWERALAIAPEHGGALRGIGFLFFRQGDNKRAIDALQHAVASNPRDDAALRALSALRTRIEAPASTSAHAAPAAGGTGPVRLYTPEDKPQLRATASAMRAAEQ